jgi:hypothetical protein
MVYKIKDFNQFLFENTNQEFEKTFIQKVVDALEKSDRFDNIEIEGNSIVYYQQHVIDSDSAYSVCNIKRPTITQDYTGRLIFEFNEKALKRYFSSIHSTSSKFGLSDPVKFSDIFVLKSSIILEITIEEIEDFFHQEGDSEFTEFNVEEDFGDETEEDFIENIADHADGWFEELLAPNQIRELLDKYEEENPVDDEDENW